MQGGSCKFLYSEKWINNGCSLCFTTCVLHGIINYQTITKHSYLETLLLLKSYLNQSNKYFCFKKMLVVQSKHNILEFDVWHLNFCFIAK